VYYHAKGTKVSREGGGTLLSFQFSATISGMIPSDLAIIMFLEVCTLPVCTTFDMHMTYIWRVALRTVGMRVGRCRSSKTKISTWTALTVTTKHLKFKEFW